MINLSIKDIKKRLLAEKKASLQTEVSDVSLTSTDELVSRLLYVLCNEDIFEPYLQELNDKLAEKFSADPHFPVPESYVFTGKTRLPQSANSEIPQAARYDAFLSEILLKQEQKHGINIHRSFDTIATFVGIVRETLANQFIANRELWDDNCIKPTMQHHGAKSHRIHHYVITRAIEDGHIKINDLFSANEPIFKKLVFPTHPFSFLFKINGTLKHRSYWIITLDNSNDTHEEGFFIKDFPGISGPAFLQAEILNEKSFLKKPFLAHAIYHSRCEPIFTIANMTGKSISEVSLYYQDRYRPKQEKQIADPAPFDIAIQNYLDRYIDMPTYKKISDAYTGILHHDSIAQEVTPLHALGFDFSTFFRALDKKEYDRALRVLCAENSPSRQIVATKLATALLAFQDRIDLNMNHTSQYSRKSFLELAKEAKNEGLCNLLQGNDKNDLRKTPRVL